MSRRIDMVGRKFGRLTVAGEFSRASDGQVVWTCACDCGNSTTVRGDLLRKGVSSSCGCLQRELMSARRTSHGMTLTPEYKAWKSMRERCDDKSNKNYGGRGIAVCDEWRDSFESFYRDMGDRPSPKHSIERMDVDGGYSKDNCRWATAVEQGRNRRVFNDFGTHGISLSKEKTYRVDIGLEGKAIYVGTFKTLTEARLARESAESIYWAAR